MRSLVTRRVVAWGDYFPTNRVLPLSCRADFFSRVNRKFYRAEAAVRLALESLDANDDVSADMMVQQMAASPDSPVLYYHPRGAPATARWKETDFVLVLATPWQLAQFAAHAWKGFILDDTFNVCSTQLSLLNGRQTAILVS